MKADGNMCGAAMRGTVALPGSEGASRTNEARWNLRNLMPLVVTIVIMGRDGKSRRWSWSGKSVSPLKPRTTPTTNWQRREWREGEQQHLLRTLCRDQHATDAASLRVQA